MSEAKLLQRKKTAHSLGMFIENVSIVTNSLSVTIWPIPMFPQFSLSTF